MSEFEITGYDISKWELMIWNAKTKKYDRIPGTDLHKAMQNPATKFMIARFSVAYWDSTTDVVADPSINYVLDVVKDYPEIPFTGFLYWSPLISNNKQLDIFATLWYRMKSMFSKEHKLLKPELDAEYHGNLPKNTVIDRFDDMLETLEDGVDEKPMVYSGAGFMNWMFGKVPSYYSTYDWHIASYKSLSYKKPTLPNGLSLSAVKFWQHTDKAVCEGLDGGVDANVFMGDSVAWTAYSGTNEEIPSAVLWTGEIMYSRTRVRTSPVIGDATTIVTQLNPKKRVTIIKDNIAGLDNTFTWAQLGGEFDGLYICTYSDKQLVRKVA